MFFDKLEELKVAKENKLVIIAGDFNIVLKNELMVMMNSFSMYEDN